MLCCVLGAALGAMSASDEGAAKAVDASGCLELLVSATLLSKRKMGEAARAVLRGTCRTLRPETRDAMEAGIARVAENTARAFGARAATDYRRNYPPTVNHAPQADKAAAALAAVVGGENVLRNASPSMGTAFGKDFKSNFIFATKRKGFLHSQSLGCSIITKVPMRVPRFDTR